MTKIRQQATGNMQQASKSRISSTQMTQIRRIFADKKKICGHLLKSVLSERLLSESGFTGFQDKQDYTLQETNTVRHCGLDPQSSFIRRIRREASRFYILEDSDFRSNDGYGYKTVFSQIRKKICGHLFKSASSACFVSFKISIELCIKY